MLSRITIGEQSMVVPSDVAEAMDAFEREMFRLKKLTEPEEITAQEAVCVQRCRHLSTIGNDEPCTATDEQFLEYVRNLRVQMETDPNWQEEPPPVEDFPEQLTAEQRGAKVRIEALGGNVWMRICEGRQVVESVAFKENNFTDAELSLLLPFRGSGLCGLAFVRARLSDKGIADALEIFPSLTSLNIFQMRIGDAALNPLQSYNDLEDFSVGQTDITSESLRHLAHQPRLQHSTISETAVDDAGLRHLEGLLELRRLFAGNTRITSAGLASVAKIGNLESLLLNDTQVGDDGLKYLVCLRNLRTLRLDGTHVTSAGMAYVAKLSALRDFDIERTSVDERGLEMLQKMPELQEVRWVPPEKATSDQKRFHFRFHAYLPANFQRAKDSREKFERGEIEFE